MWWVVSCAGAALRLAAVALAAACSSRQPPLPPPPAGVGRVAVATPENATGRDLTVTGSQLLDRFLGVPRVQVPAVLEADLRRVLAAHGFDVGTGGDVLRIRITRWEPEIPTSDWVTVSVMARLETAGGATRWEGSRRNWLVPTRGAPNVGESYAIAARAVAEALLAGWHPAP